MKKLLGFVMPLKTFAALIFAGLICLYMISGVLYSTLTGVPFNYTIPFIFAIQGLILSILIAILWGIFLGDALIKKWRYFLRYIVFALALLVLLAACLLTFFAVPTDWAKLWLIAAGFLAAGIFVLSVASEIYFQVTGKRYTEILNAYKSDGN